MFFINNNFFSCVFLLSLVVQILGMGSIHYGMEKAVIAHDMACEFEIASFHCEGQQLRIKNEILSKIPNEPDAQTEFFGKWTQNYVVTQLPEEYKKKCEKYLSNPDDKFPAAESDKLKDNNIDYPYKAYAHCIVHTLSQRSKGIVRASLEFGMRKCVEAFNKVCTYEVSFKGCNGQQEWIQNEVFNNPSVNNNTRRQIWHFGMWTQNSVITHLPNEYQEKCKKYLSIPDAQPPADESKELNDGKQIYPYVAYAYCLIHTLREKSKGAMTRDWNKIFVGMDKASHAYEVVCEYEAEHTDKCKGKLRRAQMNLMRNEYFKDTPQKLWSAFGNHQRLDALHLLPQVYQDNCKKYMEDPVAEIPVNESDALNDANMDYPYKAFAHCLMQTLRAECGGEMPPEVEEAKQEADAPEMYEDDD